MRIGVSVQTDIRCKDMFIFQIFASSSDFAIINFFNHGPEVIVRPNFRRNEQEFYTGMSLAELFEQFYIRLLKLSFIRIWRIPLKIVDSFKNHDNLRVELFKIPAFRLRIRGHRTHDRVIIEAFHGPFGYDIVVVADKTAPTEGIDLIVSIKTACKEVSEALGGIRLVKFGSVFGGRTFATVTNGKGIADELDAALGRLRRIAKSVFSANSAITRAYLR